MSAAIISFLISHILTFVESELEKEEPAILASITHDIQSLIIKLESLIESKSPAVAAAVNPVLGTASNVAVAALQAAGSVIVQGVSTPQSVA